MSDVVWKPNKRQEDFLSIPDSVFEGFYGGAAGGGKSEVLMMLPIAREFYKYPRFKALILRRTYPELERELILRSQNYYPLAGGAYNDEKKRWRFPSGATFQFGYAEYENDVRKYDTSEFNYIAYDELTSFTQFQYLYIALSRCRTSDPALPAIVRSASNPGNVGHSFVRTRFVEPNSCGYHIIIDKTTGLKRIFIPAHVDDNPHIDPGYANRLRALPEAEMRAKLLGDWWTFEGQVFDDWREQPLPNEPDNAKHVVEDFEVPSWWPRVLAIDWGFRAMFYAVWGAIAPDRRVYIYREYAVKQKNISTCAADIARLSQYEDLSDVVMDPSAFAHRGDDKTIAEQFIEHSGLTVRRADNDRVGGKILVQDYLRFCPRPARYVPPSNFDPDVATAILRQKGLHAYNEYLGSFRPEKTESNLPRLQVLKSCEVLRRTIPLCVYGEHDKEDVAEFDGDDPYDTLRYLLKATDYLLSGAHKEAERREKIDVVVKELQESNNQTRFYRKMEALERSRDDFPKPVKRRSIYGDRVHA